MKVARYEFEAIVKIARATNIGPDQIGQVLRLARILRRWAEAVCNGLVEEEEDGRAFSVSYTGARREIPNKCRRAQEHIMQILAGARITFHRDPRGAVVRIFLQNNSEVAL